MEIAVVRPLFVGAVWPAIKDYVIEACAQTNGRRTPTKVLAEAMDAITTLWVAYDDEQEVKAFADNFMNGFFFSRLRLKF